MTDEQSDYFGLNGDKSADKKGAGLVLGPQLRPNELLAAEYQHRNSAAPEFIGSTEVVFTDEDGAIEPEDAARWRTIMGWPAGSRAPTAEEVDAFKAYQQVKLTRAFWDANRKAAAADDADEAAATQGRLDRLGLPEPPLRAVKL
jgi:hypothetical protein